MTAHKTQKNDADVRSFIDSVDNEVRRTDAHTVCDLMEKAFGEKPSMWGPAIVGFGEMDNTNSMGTAQWPLIAFSPRKQNLTLYLSHDYPEFSDMLERLGKHSTSQSCLYIKRLSDVSLDVLREMVEHSISCLRSKESV